MKQMFLEEEEIDKLDANAKQKTGIPRPESSDWDLHKH